MNHFYRTKMKSISYPSVDWPRSVPFPYTLTEHHSLQYIHTPVLYHILMSYLYSSFCPPLGTFFCLFIALILVYGRLLALSFQTHTVQTTIHTIVKLHFFFCCFLSCGTTTFLLIPNSIPFPCENIQFRTFQRVPALHIRCVIHSALVKCQTYNTNHSLLSLTLICIVIEYWLLCLTGLLMCCVTSE